MPSNLDFAELVDVADRRGRSPSARISWGDRRVAVARAGHARVNGLASGCEARHHLVELGLGGARLLDRDRNRASR